MICQTRNTSRNTIGVYVAEEQEFFRSIYQVSFEMDNTLACLGVSANGNLAALQEVLAAEKPEVLIMGFKRLTADLYAELDAVSSGFPRTALIILLTAIAGDDAKLLRKIIQKCRHGVAVYMKQSLDNPKQLHDIIRSVSRGQVILDPVVANSILMEKAEYPFLKLLTDRELEILNVLAQGHTNHGIAEELCIDVKTVAHHLNNIYSKLKDDNELNQKHPRVSIARLYLETTGELMPFSAKNSVTIFPSK
jgi:DNA-binding NarL/FixJ family response regulator